MQEIKILGIVVEERSQAADKVQDILTKYGCCISTRLGIRDVNKSGCNDCGLIILELTGDPEECMRLENELWALDAVRLQKMVF